MILRAGKSELTGRGSRAFPGRTRRLGAGFTLLEMLVVIAIMGIIAAIAIPALSGTRRTSTLRSANRQLLDDLGLARLRAIKERTYVSVLFTPQGPAYTEEAYRSYALYAHRTVGDQPGQAQPRYLTDWKKLPDGVILPAEKFQQPTYQANTDQGVIDVYQFAVADFPYPTIESGMMAPFGFFTFNPQGGLDLKTVNNPSGEVMIPLFLETELRKASGPGDPAIPYNHVVVDALTGRARVEDPRIQN